MTDESLMLAYQKGSEEAFNRLYDQHSALVYGHIRRRINSSEVDDFYQKVWRHLHEKRDLYRGQPFLPWFFTLIRNLMIDEYRSLGRRSLLIKSLGEARSEEASDQDLEEILEKLSPESADLVRKYYLEEFSYEELEKETGLSQTSLRQRLSRAIRSLRGQV